MPNERDDAETTDVHRALRRLEGGMASILEGQHLAAKLDETKRELLSEVRQMRAEMDRHLHGERDGKTGIVARVTSLEASAQSKTAIIVAIISAAAALGAAVFVFLSKLGG